MLPRTHLALLDLLTRGRSAQRLTVSEIRGAQALEPTLTRPQRVLARGHRLRGLQVDEYDVGGVIVRCWWPLGLSRPLPMVLMVHGGGFAFGSAARNDWMARAVARATGAVVVSPEYRLAPDHPHPAGLDDVWTVLTTARSRVDAKRIALMGDSAGGFLAALAATRARDEGLAVAAMVLCYPATDLRLDREPVLGPRLRTSDMDRFVRMYLGGLGEDGLARGPVPAGRDVSPIGVPDLTGLPPTLIQTADHDPLERDGIAYADRLRDAGVDVTLTRYLGAAHAFYATPRLAARAANAGIAEAGQFLARHLGR